MIGMKRSASTTEQEEIQSLKAENEKLKKSLEEKDKENKLLTAAIESLKGTASYVLMELRLREGIDKFLDKDKHITNLYSEYGLWVKDVESRMPQNGGVEETERYHFYKTISVDATQIYSTIYLQISNIYMSSFQGGRFAIYSKKTWLNNKEINKTVLLLHPTDHGKSIELVPDDNQVNGRSLTWRADGIKYENAFQKTITPNQPTLMYSFLICILRKRT
eukprot:TCONS_00059976-protein